MGSRSSPNRLTVSPKPPPPDRPGRHQNLAIALTWPLAAYHRRCTPSNVAMRSATVCKPFNRSENHGNQSKMVVAHGHVTNGVRMETQVHEWGSRPRKRTPLSRNSFVIQTNCSPPSWSKLVFAGAGQRLGVSRIGGVGDLF